MRKIWGNGRFIVGMAIVWSFATIAFSLAQEVTQPASDDIDFFASEDDSSSDSVKPEKEVKTPVPQKSGLLSNLFGGEKDPDEGKSDYRTPLESVLPGNSLMMIQTVPIKQLNKKLLSLIKGLGFGDLSPLDWLRLSPYGKALRYLDQARSLGVCWLERENQTEPDVVLFIPIRRYRPFVEALGADVAAWPTDDAIPTGTLLTLTKPSDWISFQKNGYAVLLKKGGESTAQKIMNARAIGTELFYPAGLNESDVRLEVTSFGIQRFLDLNRAAETEIRTLLPILLRSLGNSDAETELNPQEITFRLDQFSEWARHNLSELVLEGKIVDQTVVTSFVFVPAPGSELASQIDNRGGPDVPTLLDQSEFLKILPATPAPLSGQTDLFPEFATKLDAPFHRIRHIEYSFGLPQEGELLAESWAFFLEVDDAEAFVRELIVPKAQLIGSHIGSEKVGQVAGEFLGNLSLRRQARGRRPLLFGSPEEAASVGQMFGSQIGGDLGSSLGEQEGMKKYDFEGYPLYVSDLILYAQQMKEIRSRERGETAPTPIFITGEPTLRNMIASVLSGLQSGSLEGVIQDQFTNLSGDGIQDGTPLLARRNLILVLDEDHILIVPGNEDILRAAKNRWREFIDQKEVGVSNDIKSPSDWRFARDLIYREMADASSQILRSAARFDLASSQILADYTRQHYAPDFPRGIQKPIPSELPTPLFISTNASGAGYLYASFPEEFLKMIIQAKLDQTKEENSDKK